MYLSSTLSLSEELVRDNGNRTLPLKSNRVAGSDEEVMCVPFSHSAHIPGNDQCVGFRQQCSFLPTYISSVCVCVWLVMEWFGAFNCFFYKKRLFMLVAKCPER